MLNVTEMLILIDRLYCIFSPARFYNVIILTVGFTVTCVPNLKLCRKLKVIYSKTQSLEIKCAIILYMMKDIGMVHLCFCNVLILVFQC